MKFLETMIVVPYYLKQTIDPIIKSSNDKFYGSDYLLTEICNHLSRRDRAVVYVLNEMFFDMLKYNKNKPKVEGNYYPYRLFPDASSPGRFNVNVGLEFDLQEESVIETLKDMTLDDKNENKYTYEDLIKIEYIRYPGKEKEFLDRVSDRGYTNRMSHVIEDRIGMIVYLNPGFGDMISGSDEYTKTEFIENLPEFLYRNICDSYDVKTANGSFLALARLKNSINVP